MSQTQPKMAIRTSGEPIATEYNIMFDSDIELQEEYHEHWYVMEHASEGDVVNVCIASNGGSVDTIAKFQDIVKKSKAHFHAKLQGSGYSAGGALFLLCDTQEVSDLATFMAHSIQTGYGGGTQAIEAHSKMSSKQNRKLCEMLYKDFLSSDEIDRICDGAEIWMDAEEITDRLLKRQEAREQEAIEEMKEQYTPEFYSQQCALDIMEDCEQFGYDPVALVAEIFKVCQESVGEVVEEGTITEADIEELLENPFVDIYNTDDIDELKSRAQGIDVKFSHNIGIETLRKRVIDKVEES